MQASATKYWQAASQSLAPQLEQLAETGAHYHRQVSGVVANVTQKVTGTELHPDVLQFTQVGPYSFGLLRIPWLTSFPGSSCAFYPEALL